MKKKLAVIITVLLIAASVTVKLAVPSKPDIKAQIVSIDVLEASETQTQYILELDGNEFGYGTVIIKIMPETTVKRSDGMAFVPDAFKAGDIVSVWYDKSTAKRNIITAEQVVFESGE